MSKFKPGDKVFRTGSSMGTCIQNNTYTIKSCGEVGDVKLEEAEMPRSYAYFDAKFFKLVTDHVIEIYPIY